MPSPVIFDLEVVSVVSIGYPEYSGDQRREEAGLVAKEHMNPGFRIQGPVQGLS